MHLTNGKEVLFMICGNICTLFIALVTREYRLNAVWHLSLNQYSNNTFLSATNEHQNLRGKQNITERIWKIVHMELENTFRLLLLQKY
jgi:hypothetical protein